MEKEKTEEDENIKKLYLDRKKKSFIQFTFDESTTCKNLLDMHKYEITTLLKQINNYQDTKDIPLETYFFYLVELPFPSSSSSPSSSTPEPPLSYIDIKINFTDKISEIFQNISNKPNYIFCYLSSNNHKVEVRQKARSNFVLEKDIYEDIEKSNTEYSQSNIINFLSNKQVYLYDDIKKSFSKEKGSVNERQILIENKNKTSIWINEIKKDAYYTDSALSKTSPNFQIQIKGDKPKYYIVLVLSEKTYILGFYKESYYSQWSSAIKSAIIIDKNSIVDLNLDNDISAATSSLFVASNLIIDKCFLINEILCNNEKRKMFFEVFPQKKIASIIEHIVMYKYLIRKQEFLESWVSFKQILAYIGENGEKVNEDEKLKTILTQDRIEKFNYESKKIDDLLQNINKNATKGNLQNDMNKGLKSSLKENLFDELYFFIYNMYILPFFENVKSDLQKGSPPQNKTLLRQKFQILLAVYFFQIFNMTQSFNYIGENNSKKSIKGRTTSYIGQFV